MISSRVTFAFASLFVTACSSPVNLGGPRDGGSPAASSSTGEDAGPLQDLNTAQSYANGDAGCATAADCCVVVDGCMNEALVVGAKDQATVANLVAAYDQAEYALGPQARCTGCVPPPVQVSCVQNKCVGSYVGFESPDGGEIDPSFMQNHCGTLPNAPAAISTGSVLGC